MSQENVQTVAPVKRTKLRVVSDVLLFVSTLLILILSFASFSMPFVKNSDGYFEGNTYNALSAFINFLNDFSFELFDINSASDIVLVYQSIVIMGVSLMYFIILIVFTIMAIVRFAKKDSFKLSVLAFNAFRITLTTALVLSMYCVSVEIYSDGSRMLAGTMAGNGLIASIAIGAVVMIVCSILNYVDNKNKVNPHTDGKKRWIAAFVTGIISLVMCAVLLSTHLANVLYYALDELFDSLRGFDFDEFLFAIASIMLLMGVINANKTAVSSSQNNFLYTLTYGIENELKEKKKKDYSLVKFVSLIVFLSIALVGAILTNFDVLLDKGPNGVFVQVIILLLLAIGSQIALKVLVGKLVKNNKGVVVPEAQKKYEEERLNEELQKQKIEEHTVYVQPMPNGYAQAPTYQQSAPVVVEMPAYQPPVQTEVQSTVEPVVESEPVVEVAPAYAPPVEAQPEGWFCPMCGKQNSGNFCGRCGTKKPQ